MRACVRCSGRGWLYDSMLNRKDCFECGGGGLGVSKPIEDNDEKFLKILDNIEKTADDLNECGDIPPDDYDDIIFNLNQARKLIEERRG